MHIALLVAALAGAAASSDDPGAFVDGLYAYYAASDPGPRGDEEVFAPDIVALFARQEALAGPDEVVRDGDEICQCQDWDNLRVIERVVRPTGEGRAEADVRFENFGEVRSAHLLLAHTPDGWRVADIADVYDGQSLATYLREDVARAERARR